MEEVMRVNVIFVCALFQVSTLHCNADKSYKKNFFFEEISSSKKTINNQQKDAGIDDSKYLSLINLPDGNFDLPERADYSGEVGTNLLKYIKPGDILYDSVGSHILFGYTGHVALIEGVFYSQTYSQYYIVTIEANPSVGVRRGYVDVKRFEDKKTILRVTGATSSKVEQILYFARTQIGDHYWLESGRSTSIEEDYWYCSELVHAAYYYAQLDISNGTTHFIFPYDIANDQDSHIIMKSGEETTIESSLTRHTYCCYGDSFSEIHKFAYNSNGDKYCMICNFIDWPTC